jgi:hypothetical protein
MDVSQANLMAAFPAFLNALKIQPGGLPDLHIAVVTSDMGAGDGVSIMGCSITGDDGVFRFAPGIGCTAASLDVGATFISYTGGTSPQANFTGDISAVFSCIAAVGATGCGFEHQLASIARALGADGAAPPPENQGFLRDDAHLAIIMITNEDDCSAPFGSALFDPTSSMLASPYGPTENFQCNEWGHLCSLSGGPFARPSRFAPNNLNTDVVTYSPAGGPDNCVSAEGQGLLTLVGSGGYADGIKALKADPAHQILVAAIAGPTTPYVVTWRTAPTTDTGPWPQIAHSCGSDVLTSTGFADPGVRINQFVTAFGSNGLTYSFCAATRLAQLLGP